MKDHADLGALLEAFINKVWHPRGRALKFVTKASITGSQVILLDYVRLNPNITPSSLAATIKVSLPLVSQMVERLVKLGFLQRTENPEDRRQKTVRITAAARAFLTGLKAVRSAEYAAGAPLECHASAVGQCVVVRVGRTHWRGVHPAEGERPSPS